MNSFFSVFDPSSIGGELNWIFGAVPLILVLSIFGGLSISDKIIKNGFLFIHNDLIIIHKSPNFRGESLIFLIIFFELSCINFFGLFPFIFTPSSHLSFAFILSIFLWIGSQCWAWVKRTKVTLAHLVPEGTPFALMPFLVFIELIRNFIRPLTLRIRLVANISAGHLLLSLLGSYIDFDNFIGILLLIIILTLFILLEISVAFIQAYVFIRLTSLYVKEAV